MGAYCSCRTSRNRGHDSRLSVGRFKTWSCRLHVLTNNDDTLHNETIHIMPRFQRLSEISPHTYSHSPYHAVCCCDWSALRCLKYAIKFQYVFSQIYLSAPPRAFLRFDHRKVEKGTALFKASNGADYISLTYPRRSLDFRCTEEAAAYHVSHQYIVRHSVNNTVFRFGGDIFADRNT